MVSLDESVQNLVALSGTVNNLADRLNFGLAYTEEQLRGGGVGVGLFLQDAPIETAGPDPVTFVLGWEKEAGVWQLAYFYPPADETTETGSILGAPRAIRIAAWAHIDQLIDALTISVAAELKEFETLESDLPDLPGSDDVPF